MTVGRLTDLPRCRLSAAATPLEPPDRQRAARPAAGRGAAHVSAGEDEAGADRAQKEIAADLRGRGRFPHVIHLAPVLAPR